MKTALFRGLALAATVVACLNSPAFASGPDYVIRHDIGGNGAQYLAKAKRVGAEGRMVVIDGTCASACTFFLHREAGTKFCATPRARLGFHKPYRTNQSGSVQRGSAEETTLDDIWKIIVAGTRR